MKLRDELPDWEKIFAEAEQRLEEVVAALPDYLRREAESIPCLLEKWPDKSLDPDTMGFYPYFEEGKVSSERGPILLYLGTIHTICELEGKSFADEVERTYLHELGHVIGFDEDDLADRGLD